MRKCGSVLTAAMILTLVAVLAAQEETPTGAEGEARASHYIAALNSRFLEERREAGRKLEAIGEAAIRPLVEALRSGDPGLRSSAAIVLGRMKVKEAVPELIELAEDPALAVRKHAAQALVKVGADAAGVLRAELRESRGERREFIGKILDRVVLGAVRKYLDDMTVTPRLCLYVPGPIEELKKLGPEARRALEQLSDWNTHNVTSYHALNTIGELRDTAAVEFLKKKHDEALTSKPRNMVYRAAAAMALAKLGVPSYSQKLISEILKDEYHQPAQPEAKHSSAGATYLEMGLADEALKHFHEARKRKPTEMAYTFRLGCAYALKGDAAMAVSFLKEAVKEGFIKASLLVKIGYFKKIRATKEWKNFISEALKKENEQASGEKKGTKEALKQ